MTIEQAHLDQRARRMQRRSAANLLALERQASSASSAKDEPQEDDKVASVTAVTKGGIEESLAKEELEQVKQSLTRMRMALFAICCVLGLVVLALIGVAWQVTQLCLAFESDGGGCIVILSAQVPPICIVR